jgi:hypothetical protein
MGKSGVLHPIIKWQMDKHKNFVEVKLIGIERFL